MTLPAVGTQILASQINTELGRTSTAQIGIGSDAGARALAAAGAAGTQIGMSAGYGGKSSYNLTTPTPGATLTSEGNTNGGTFYAYVQPGVDGLMGSVFNTSGSNPAFGSSSGGSIASGKYFKYTGTASHTNMAADTWYPVGSGYYCGAKRTNANGTTTSNLSISFANDASGNGATTAGSWTFSVTIAPF
jgi:hypothetical protein